MHTEHILHTHTHSTHYVHTKHIYVTFYHSNSTSYVHITHTLYSTHNMHTHVTYTHTHTACYRHTQYLFCTYIYSTHHKHSTECIHTEYTLTNRELEACVTDVAVEPFTCNTRLYGAIKILHIHLHNVLHLTDIKAHTTLKIKSKTEDTII